MNLFPILGLVFLLPAVGMGEEEFESAGEAIANLTDPKKLASLKGERAVNPRFQKCIWYLSQRTTNNQDPAVVINTAMEINKTAGTAYSKAVKRALMEGLYAHNKFGGVQFSQEMRQGKSYTITKGKYAGQEATADQIIPLSVCPELQNQIFNLQLLPASLNSSKGNKVGAKQVRFAEDLNKNGLLSAEGLDAVKKAYEKEVEPTPAPVVETESEKQARLNEESRQLELEVVRAERKGTEAVYDVYVERLEKLGEQANKSKASSDVLIFEKTLNSALSIWERMFEENWDARNGGGEWKQKRYELKRSQEVAHLESFLDESLRAK